MGYLLSSGASFSLGYELETEIGYLPENGPFTQEDLDKITKYREDKSFSKLISNKLNLNLVNISEAGASNEYIIYKTIDFIKSTKTKPNFVLVNLAAPNRFYYKFDNISQPVFINFAFFDSWVENFFKSLNFNFVKLKNWFEVNQKYQLNEYTLIDKQQKIIEHLVLYLESEKINYFISPTTELDFNLSDITKNSVNISVNKYLDSLGLIQPKNRHWLSDGHKLWGEFLYQQIVKNDI